MDKVMSLIQSVADKIGKTVELLWPEAVRYTAIYGLFSILAPVTLSAIAFGAFLWCRAQDWTGGHVGDRYPTVKTVALVAAIMFLFIAILSSCEYGPRLIEPEGYLVTEVLRSVGK